MNAEELGHGINKGLEVWSLQSICDLAIVLSFVALALVAGRPYLDGIRQRLSLRVAAEAWETGTDVLTDLLLGFVALVGLFVINPDIMADIKIGVPWVPLAMVLTAVALVLRVFYGARIVGSAAWWSVFGLLLIACAANWFGFTFVMEAADDEYLRDQTVSLWPTLQHMRSDFNSDLAMATVQWANPALCGVFLWAIITGAVRSVKAGPKK